MDEISIQQGAVKFDGCSTHWASCDKRQRRKKNLINFFYRVNYTQVRTYKQDYISSSEKTFLDPTATNKQSTATLQQRDPAQGCTTNTFRTHQLNYPAMLLGYSKLEALASSTNSNQETLSNLRKALKAEGGIIRVLPMPENILKQQV